MMYNVTGMFVTDNIGAVARTVLESLRTLFVWLVGHCKDYFPPVPWQAHRIEEALHSSSMHL